MREKVRIGMHASIAGGLSRAVNAAVETGCECFQIFARNPRGWLARPLESHEIHDFRVMRERAGLWPLAIHTVYLVNLASSDPVLLARSREAFREEIRRGIALGADYLVVHPGSYGSADLEVGIATAVESIRKCARGLGLTGASSSASRAGAAGAMSILIENTAGQGSSIGCNFEQIAELLRALNALPVDVCLDTAHTFASGYDISTVSGLGSTIRAINQSFGFDRIKLIHCNDSKVPLSSRVDRHQHIGLGCIGAEAFGRIMHNLRFGNVPFILETPVDKERGYAWNVARLRELSRSDAKWNLKSG